jgi:hypothetical protein
MERKHPPADGSTDIQCSGKYQHLIAPVPFELGSAVESDFANVACLLDEPLEQRELLLPFMRDLRMQSKGRTYAGGSGC